MRVLAGVAALILASTAGAAEIDLGAPEGAERTTYLIRDGDRYELPIGPVRWNGALLEPVTGRTVWSAFRIPGGIVSPLDVMAGYQSRLEELGFETVFLCWTEACGGFDFRFGVAVLPAPDMRVDVRAFGQLSAMRQDPEAYASVLVSTLQDATYVQTVAVTPGGAATDIAAAPVDRSTAQAARQGVGPGDARALGELLRQNGHAPIEGLEFETGGATLSGDSGTALDVLARLLIRDAELDLMIVGHSDNEGALEANIDLSRRRAAAVLDALVQRGVPRDRLDAQGIGYLAPLTTNDTEEGRLINRRVELVVR